MEHIDDQTLEAAIAMLAEQRFDFFYYIFIGLHYNFLSLLVG